MKTNQLIATSLLLISLSTASAFAGTVCDINNANSPTACTAKVSNLRNNNVPFQLLNINPTSSYDCNIVIEGDNANQVSTQNMQGKNGASVILQGRSQNSIPFTVNNSSSLVAMVSFNMHNGRKSKWKNESNTVYVLCNKSS